MLLSAAVRTSELQLKDKCQFSHDGGVILIGVTPGKVIFNECTQANYLVKWR